VVNALLTIWLTGRWASRAPLSLALIRGIFAVTTRSSIRNLAAAGVGIGLAGSALLWSGAAAAQGNVYLPELAPLSVSEVQSLPPEYRTGPVMPAPTMTSPSVLGDRTETTIGPDGVETVTRTRYIQAQRPMGMAPAPIAPVPVAPYPGAMIPQQGYAPMPYAPAPVVFERQQWLDECYRRTAGRNERQKGTIIGGLLGAIAGGVIGNRVAGAGDRLLGTAIGAGGGGLVGGILGNLIGGGKKRGRYDCEAALDGYLSQYATGGVPMAGYAYPAYAQQMMVYAQPAQMVVVPVRSQQQQQVVVRETVREEVVPGATRYIPAPQPRPTKLIKVR
jgi:hypothetical protein